MTTVTDKKSSISWAAFVIVLAAALILNALYFYNIVQWRNYPDFGWGFSTATGVDFVAFVRDEGRAAGLQMSDRIQTVNGKTFSNRRELRAALNWDIGQENVYIVERPEGRAAIHIVNKPVGFAAAFNQSGYLFLLGLCFLFTGTIVFLMKKHARTSWIFFLFTAMLGLCICLSFRIGKMTPLWLETVENFTRSFAPAVFIHLALGFPEEWGILKRRPRIQYAPYVISGALFMILTAVAPNPQDAPPSLRLASTVYIYGAVIVFFGSCAWHVLKSSSETSRMRSKIILLGSAIASAVPLADLFANTVFNVYLLPNNNYNLPFYVFFPLSIGYAIVRYNLFGFDAIIKRTYGYLLTTGAVAAVYGLFVLVSNVAFGHLEATKSQAFPLVFVLLVVLFFNPIRNRAQQFIDRTFYRLEYDYQETVQRISETMCSLQNLAQVTRGMMDTALGTMFIDSGCLMVLNRTGGTFDCRVHVRRENRNPARTPNGATPGPGAGPGHSLPADEPFLKGVAEKKQVVSRYDLEEDPFFEGRRETGREVFDQLNATLVVPIIYENELKGLMGLGEKLSGKYYRIEDIKLLNTLANQGAVAIENAVLLEDVIEKERMEEELSIARDLQRSMLPAACPQTQGFDIAALCLPAREVGGDFYDFIEMGEDRVGLIVGDVTGKGVSGALVMSAARSVFRMLSERQMPPGEIMAQANRRAGQDIRQGMSVSTLYAVLDGRERTLRFVNAGQTHPIVVSAKTGRAALLEAGGDCFPLGLVPEALYEERSIALEPGDRIVFYTDGVVEALDEKGEMYGFGRLMETLEGLPAGSARELLTGIRGKIEGFVGKAHQHDDITLIVVGVTGS